jgi:hypothetical protein
MMIYLAARGIAGCIKERRVNKKKPGRPSLFDYETYTKIRSSVEILQLDEELPPDSDKI